MVGDERSAWRSVELDGGDDAWVDAGWRVGGGCGSGRSV